MDRDWLVGEVEVPLINKINHLPQSEGASRLIERKREFSPRPSPPWAGWAIVLMIALCFLVGLLVDGGRIHELPRPQPMRMAP